MNDESRSDVPRPVPSVGSDRGRRGVEGVGREGWKGSIRRIDRIGRWALIPVLFFVYSVSFAGIPGLEREVDVLGDGDHASYAIAVRDFRFGEPLGDKYATQDRTTSDIAEKHRIHHLPYVAFAAAVYRAVLRPVYGILGMPPERALMSVNALVVCINVVLLLLLLRFHNPARNPLTPFTLLYGLSLTAWVFGSTLDSWPFTTAMVLSCFWIVYRYRPPPWVEAVLVGLIMTNNLAMGVLLLFPFLDRASRGGGVVRVLAAGAGYLAVALATWTGLLLGLSIFDPAFRPDRVIEYTFWFKDYTALDLPPWDPFVWKSIGSNLFYTSIFSYQGNPAMPQDALLRTLRHGGALAWLSFLAYSSLLVLFLVRVGQDVRGWLESDRAGEEIGSKLLQYRPLVMCAVIVVVTLVLYYRSGFLYANLAVPMLALAFCRFLDLDRILDSGVLLTSLLFVVFTNWQQVERFREVLLGMGGS